MKKLYITLLTLISLNFVAQKDMTRYYNSWRLGLNLGGTWQTSDVRSCWGLAGGITLEKGLGENATNIFSWAIRGRYLSGTTYGMNLTRNYNVKENDAYNGTYNPIVNYVDSVPLSKQYVFDNYKMKLNEGSLELQLNFNRLRERTHVILNVWGGIGFTSFSTYSDLLDGDGKKYNFSKIDSTGNTSKALTNYNLLIDQKYETTAYGSKNGNTVTFSPSMGLGLGYQFSPRFSMLLDYKVTLPQGANADLLDGKLNANSDNLNSSKDYYHYLGVNLLFTLHGKKKKTNTVKDETVYTNTTVPTNTTTIVPSETITPINPVVVSPVVTPTVSQEPKPIISFITPPVSGQVVNIPQYKISAQILNVTNSSQIKFYVNNNLITNYSMNYQMHVLEYTTNLIQGVNNIQLKATNNSGSDTKYTTINYEVPQPEGNPPTVVFTSPNNCPLTVQSSQYNVTAFATNITSKNEVQIYVNNALIPNFSFSNGTISFPLNLVSGNNAISISVNNNVGSDSKICNIVYSQPIQQQQLPLVTITNPPQAGYVSSSQNFVITAQVLNVPSQNNISVYYNGISTPFNYNSSSKQVSFNAQLNNGSNSISVSAYNSAGDDTKNSSVVYNPPQPTGNPPSIVLVNPSQINNATNNALYTFDFNVLNVASQNDIVLTFNGNTVSNFTYNTSTKKVMYSTNLNTGNNTLTILATNAFGADTKTIFVQYTQPVQTKMPPKIVFTNPATSPITSSTPLYNHVATITNMANITNGVSAKFNGVAITTYNFDGYNFSFNGTLLSGNNTLQIIATNNDGSDTETAVVNYKQKVISIPPVVSLINPMLPQNATNNALYTFKLSVLNVSSSNDIEVLFNGNPQTNFTYNTTTKEVDFIDNLVSGNNTLLVKGTNQYGSDFKQIYVNYTPVVIPKTPPTVSIINPTNNNTTVTQANYTFKGLVTFAPNASDLVVNYNGNLITNFTYDGSNLSYATILNTGTNTFEIIASNADGTDSKNVVVNYMPRVIATPPVVTILNPTNTPTVTMATYTFNFKATNVNQTQVTVTLNGNAITNYNYAGSLGSFTSNLNVGLNTLVVSATNMSGSDTKTESVYFIEEVSSPATTSISATPPDTVSSEKSRIVICHTPPGNNQNPQTITIPLSAWPAHQAHGDTQGPCVAEKVITPQGNGNTTNPKNNKPVDAVITTETVTPKNDIKKTVVDTLNKVITPKINEIKRPR